MNRVLLTGRLTRDPELRTLAGGKTVTQFSVATNDYRSGAEKAEYHSVVTWDRLAEICGQFLGKGQLVALEGRLQTRKWEDDHKIRHWKTEVVASSVEMLSGRRKKDYAMESAADSLVAQAAAMGMEAAEESSSSFGSMATPAGSLAEEDEDIEQDEEDEEAVAVAA